MTTLILPPRYNEDSIRLWKAACERGWDTIRMSAPEVERMSDESLAHWRAQESLVFYGYDYEARYIANTFGWDLLEPAENWLCNLPKELTGRHIAHMTLRQFRDQRFHPVPTFIKCAGDKHFLARIINSLDDLPSDLDPDLPVLVQTPCEMGYEYRCFVLDGRVLTCSSYRTPGKEGEDIANMDDEPVARDFIASLPGLPRGCVVDLYETYDPVRSDAEQLDAMRWCVVEANAPFCSGLYGCDPDKALDVISACAVRRPR